MSFNKQNMDFLLPSLLKNHKFQELVYEHNKFIVYDEQNLQSKPLFKPSLLSRPQTSVSINKKLQSKLVHERSKASVQKYIMTHKKINQQRLKPLATSFTKRKYDRNLFQKTQFSTSNLFKQNHNQDPLHINLVQEIPQQKQNHPQLHKSLENKQTSMVNRAEDNLINEIKSKSGPQQLKKVRNSIKSVNSVDRISISKDKIELEKLNERNQIIRTLSVGREKGPGHLSTKTTFPARKSISVNSKDGTRKTRTNQNLSSFSSKENLRNQSNVKQPQIKIQSSSTSLTSSLEKVQNDSLLKRLYDPILELFGPKDLYSKQQSKAVLMDTIINAQLGELDYGCFFSKDSLKRKTYIDSQISRLQRKVTEQDDIIKQKQHQIDWLKREKSKNQPQDNLSHKQPTDEFKQAKNILQDQGSNQQENQKQNPDQSITTKIDRSGTQERFLSQIKEEQPSSFKQVLDQDKKERLLIKQIQELDKSLNSNGPTNNMLKRQNQSIANLTRMFRKKQGPAEFGQSKKIGLHSRLQKCSSIVSIRQDNLKRAEITNYLNERYYHNLSSLYWVLVNQKSNAVIKKNQDISEEVQDSYQDGQSLKYIKQVHKTRKPFAGYESKTDEQILEEEIYVDNDFPYQSIEIPGDQQIHWLYFRPCQQSSLFPNQVLLPNHYLTASEEEIQQLSPSLFVSLINCVLTLNHSLIQRLFEPCYNNVFACWINTNNTFELVFVDGYLPYDGKLNSLFAWSEEFLWIGVLLKACAKSLGGYRRLFSLKIQDYMRMILGKTLMVLQKPTYDLIETWKEQNFEQKMKSYFETAQKKYSSSIVIRSKTNNSFFLIKSIKKNNVKLLECGPKMTKLEISLFQLILEKKYELLLFPLSKSLYQTTSEYQSYEKGNIITYQMKIHQSKTSVTISNQLSNETKELFSQKKGNSSIKRRILVYEIPFRSKKEKKSKKEMILKYTSDSCESVKTYRNHQGTQILQMEIPEMKKGQYKIFIECGKIKLNDFFETHSQTINKWLKTEQSANQQVCSTKAKQNSKYTNIISFISNSPLTFKGGKSLIINQKTQENEILQDENFRYLSTKIDSTQFEEQD